MEKNTEQMLSRFWQYKNDLQIGLLPTGTARLTDFAMADVLDYIIDDIEGKQNKPEVKADEGACEEYVSLKELNEQINCWIGSGEYALSNGIDYLRQRIKNLPVVNLVSPKGDK